MTLRCAQGEYVAMDNPRAAELTDYIDRIRQRMVEYETKTALLTGYYKPRGVVRRVNGVGSVDEVEKRIGQALR